MNPSHSLKRLRPRAILCGALVLGLVFFLSALPDALAQQQSLQDIYAAAKKEGTVVWYVTFPLDEATPLGKAFEERYPGVKVEIVRGSGTRLAERFETEYRANQQMCDVFTGALLDPFLAYKKSGWLMEWKAPEGAAIPEKYKDEGFWYLEGITMSSMLYDPERVKQEEIPHDPMDLVKPHWTGRVGTIPSWATGTGFEFAYFVEYVVGFKDYPEKLKEVDPKMQSAQAKLVRMVTSGEIDLAFPIADYNLYRFKKLGARIEGVYPKEGAPTNTRPVAIPANAPHPNAAKLFLNWRLSEDGQIRMQDGFGMRSVREGIPSVKGLTPMKDIKVLIFDPEKIRPVREDIINHWRSVFGG
jgi:iron(III) transport system substrate-binding protein